MCASACLEHSKRKTKPPQWQNFKMAHSNSLAGPRELLFLSGVTISDAKHLSCDDTSVIIAGQTLFRSRILLVCCRSRTKQVHQLQASLRVLKEKKSLIIVSVASVKACSVFHWPNDLVQRLLIIQEWAGAKNKTPMYAHETIKTTWGLSAKVVCVGCWEKNQYNSRNGLLFVAVITRIHSTNLSSEMWVWMYRLECRQFFWFPLHNVMTDVG